jgi:plasmid stabilization system protein ParE
VSPDYRLTPEAQAHVDEIAAFIAEDNVAAALLVLDALERAFVQHAAMPEIGHTREDLTARPVKFWGVYSYLVVYDPASNR